jgi:hypothetical protein
MDQLVDKRPKVTLAGLKRRDGEEIVVFLNYGTPREKTMEGDLFFDEGSRPFVLYCHGEEEFPILPGDRIGLKNSIGCYRFYDVENLKGVF